MSAPNYSFELYERLLKYNSCCDSDHAEMGKLLQKTFHNNQYKNEGRRYDSRGENQKFRYGL